MSQDYQELIRQMLDEAGLINKEMTFGCKIIVTLFGKPEIMIALSPTMMKDSETDATYGITRFKNDGVPMEILGHHWDIREVMRWIHTHDYALRTGGMLLPLSGGGGAVLLDLSKPLSKQDLKPLYELMLSLKK